MLVEERSISDYLLKKWKWNEGRYNVQKGLRDLVDTLNKVRKFVHGPLVLLTTRTNRKCPRSTIQ